MPRKLGELLLIAGVVITHNFNQLGDLGDDGSALLGPVIANAVDGFLAMYGEDSLSRLQVEQGHALSGGCRR